MPPSGLPVRSSMLMAVILHNERKNMEYTLITGASSGVGRELAIYLSKTRKLILNGRNKERLLETAERCENEPLIWQFDLGNTAELETAFGQWVKENEVAVEAFVHCAGLMKMVPLRAVNEEVLASTFGVNVFAPALITKILSSRKFNGRNLKSAVFISSNISNRGAAAFSSYGSSKAALDGLMRNLSVELAPNVRVNSVLPGGMITEMTKDIFDDEVKKAEFEKNYPLGIGTPNDIAPMVEFLLSDKASWITGQQFVVDGGRTIDITERSK